MDTIRLLFPEGRQRHFVQGALTASRLTVNQLARILNVSGRTLRDWRREKFSIPLSAVKLLSKNYSLELPDNLERMENAWRSRRSEKSRIGGISRFKKHGRFATKEGCRKGGINSIIKRYGNLLKPFTSPPKSDDLAEFFGILLGDGGLTKEQWSITINSIADADYAEYLSRSTKKLFGFEPSIYKKKDCNALVVMGSGKKSIEFFTNYGLRVGNKVRQQVGVPGWITRDFSFSISCLRGLIDTDGGIFKHKYMVGGKQYNYLKLCFSNRSLPLIKFVSETLRLASFHPKEELNFATKRVWLYNNDETIGYLKRVGSHNNRLYKNLEGDSHGPEVGLLNQG